MVDVNIASNTEYIENRQGSGTIQYTCDEGDLVGHDSNGDTVQADADATASPQAEARGAVLGPAKDPANYGSDFAETVLVVESNYDLVGQDRKVAFEYGVRVRNADEDWGFSPGEVYLDKGGGYTQDLSNHGPGDLKQVVGYAKPGPTEDSGVANEVVIAVQPAEEIAYGEGTISGDGASTVFTFPHNLSFTPSNVRLTPQSSEAAAAHYVSNVTDTSVEVTFSAAPADGTDNVVFDYEAHE